MLSLLLRRCLWRGVTPCLLFLMLMLTFGCEQKGVKGGADRAGDNLILIIIDTLRADHLGCYGYSRDTSPYIDQLARGGTLFTQAEVQWPKTAPSMASMLTSTYCTTNRVRRLRVRMDDRLVTLAEVLRDEEFYTAAFIANVNLAVHFNFPQGFREVCEMWDHSRGTPRSNDQATFWSNDQIATTVAAWLRDHQEQRFFLWVHLLDPHGPYLPPESLAGRFVGDEIYQARPDLPPPQRIPSYQHEGGHRTMGDFIAAYDAEIAYSDAAVKTILDQLDQLGLRQHSLVVLSADHGESLGEHDYYFNHGNYAYEACTRVPLIFSHPTLIPAGKRIDTPVALLDLVPTVLDLLEVQPDPPIAQFQGESLAAVFAGQPLEPRPIFIESRQGQFAVRNGNWKLIFDPRKSTPAIPVSAREQLYDLGADPLEAHNVFDQHPEVVAELRGLVRGWRQFLQKSESLFSEQRVSDESLDPRTRKQLESLGYIGDQPTEPDDANKPAQQP